MVPTSRFREVVVVVGCGRWILVMLVLVCGGGGSSSAITYVLDYALLSFFCRSRSTRRNLLL